MDKLNNDYIQKRDKLLTDVYQIGRTDATLQSDDWKELEDGVREALDALVLEVVNSVIGEVDPTGASATSERIRQKAKELINPVEDTE